MDGEHAALHYVPDVDQYIIRDLGSATGVCDVYMCVCTCMHVCVCVCVCVSVCLSVCLSALMCILSLK